MLVGLGAFFRIVWLLAVAIDPVSDGAMYRDFSNSMANGWGYAYPNGVPTAYWAVGASAFYSLIHVLFGAAPVSVAIANLLLGVGIIYFSFSIGDRYFGSSVGTVSGVLMAMWPVLIEFTTVYASELVFIFFLLAALNVWGAGRGVFWQRSVLWGGLLCIATYVRPTALPLFFVLPAIDFLLKKNACSAIFSMIVAILTAALLFAPWVVRNQQLFGSPVLVSVNFGTNLWMGNNPLSDGGYMELPDIPFANEVERDKYFKNEAIQFIMANPLQYLKLAARRAAITYDRETIGVAWNEPALRKLVGDRGLMVIKAVSTVYWWVVLLLAACGVGLLLWRKKSNLLHPLVVVSGFFFIVPILTVGQDRYHMPLNPFLAMFAAVALEAAWRCCVVRRVDGSERAEADGA
ncbi:MAG: hypothetical protein KGN32_13330 [Burkholderiales bacterium]|nr:hypothetical protein [Burkholderiales bacterium]